MRVRLKTRAILAYLGVMCCGTCLFGIYFMYAPGLPAHRSRRAIERAARDSWRQPQKPEHRSDYDQGMPQEPDPENIVLQPPQTELVLPTKAQLLNMTWEDLSTLYHRYTQQIQVQCGKVERLGKVTDGGWEVCEDAPYTPDADGLVYSFGVGNDFSFDDAVARRYGCEVHSFDPSMKSGDHQRESTVHFHAVGLADFSGETSNGWKMSTLQDIQTSLGHTQKRLSLLKLDIEEWEWKVLPHLLSHGGLTGVGQLLMELHQCDGCASYNPEQLDKEPPKDRYATALGALRDLYDLGFRIFWHHQNKACRYVSKFGLVERNACCEIHMVRVRQ